MGVGRNIHLAVHLVLFCCTVLPEALDEEINSNSIHEFDFVDSVSEQEATPVIPLYRYERLGVHYAVSDPWGFPTISGDKKLRSGHKHNYLGYAWGWNPSGDCQAWQDAKNAKHSGWLSKKDKKKNKRKKKRSKKKCKRWWKKVERKRKKQWKHQNKYGGVRQPCGEKGCVYSSSYDEWNGWEWWKLTSTQCKIAYGGWNCKPVDQQNHGWNSGPGWW